MDAQTIEGRYEAFRRLVASKYPNWQDELHEELGLTRNHVTYVMKSQRHLKMTVEELMTWANTLGISASELWYEYGCGYESLSMSQVNEVVSKSGQSLNITVLEHAA